MYQKFNIVEVRSKFVSFGMTPGLDQENRDILPAHDASRVNCYDSALSVKGSRVIVTGGAGFLGSAIVRRALIDGAEVVATVRPGSDISRLATLESDCQISPVDLADFDAMGKLVRREQPQLVVHAAAAKHVSGTTGCAAAWRDNLTVTLALLDALNVASDAVLVHVGSSTEYGPSDAPMVEDQPGQPITLRGASKLAATIAVRQWAAERARLVTVVRPFSIYGPGEHPTKLIPTLMWCAMTGAGFPLVPVISRRDLVYVEDVAEGCLRAVTVADEHAPVINLGTGIEHTVDEVVAAVERATGRNILSLNGARAVQALDTPHWVADTTRCREMLRWVPSTSLAKGLQLLVTGTSS